MAHHLRIWHALAALVVGVVATIWSLGQSAEPSAVAARTAQLSLLGSAPPPRTYGCGVPLLDQADRQLALAYAKTPATQEQFRLAGRVDGAGLLINESAGQVRDFWAYNFGTGSHYQTPATLRRVTPRGYIYVANDQAVSEEALDALAQQWEAIYATTTGVFGAAPDIDSDGRVTLLLLDLGDGTPDDPVRGYATQRNQFPAASYSNARDLIYLDTNPTPVGSAVFLGALAHQLAHLINWNLHRDAGGQELWLDEGLAELARFRNGFGHSAAAGFFTNPDKPLTRWAPGQENLAASYLFLLYFWEQFGDAGIYEVVHHFGTDIDAVEGALRALRRPESFAEVFHRWTLANFLDDTTLSGGVYGYRTLDLVSGEYDGVTTFPRAYRTTEFIPPASDLGRVQHWAARYYRFFGKTGVLNLDFLGNDYNRFRVTALASSVPDFRSGNAVFPVALNAAQDGGLALADFGTAYPSVVLVVSSAADHGGPDYTFSASVVAAAPPATPTPTAIPQGFSTPTPTAVTAQPTPTPFSVQPTPVRAGQPTATPIPGWTAVATTCCVPSVQIVPSSPSAFDSVTIYGRLVDGAGRPAPGAIMEVLWYFDTLAPARCVSAPATADGVAACTMTFAGQATAGRTVPIHVRFHYQNQAYSLNTSVTPR
ncbi:MAG: hypothetical protein HY689_14820 [Chloroflexi bacterium]|nr:hypothetical protein [Chloroflexota bacterium]